MATPIGYDTLVAIINIIGIGLFKMIGDHRNDRINTYKWQMNVMTWNGKTLRWKILNHQCIKCL